MGSNSSKTVPFGRQASPSALKASDLLQSTDLSKEFNSRHNEMHVQQRIREQNSIKIQQLFKETKELNKKLMSVNNWTNEESKHVSEQSSSELSPQRNQKSGARGKHQRNASSTSKGFMDTEERNRLPSPN